MWFLAISEPDVVQTLSARNTSSTSVSVYWNKPVNTNGVIIKYNLIIKQDGRCIRRISLNCDDCTSPCPEVTLKQVYKSFFYTNSLFSILPYRHLVYRKNHVHTSISHHISSCALHPAYISLQGQLK